MEEPVNIRRAPKLLPFGITGAILGVILGVGLYLLAPAAGVNEENALGLFIVYVGGTGAAIGVVLAILVDWLTLRKTKQAIASRSEETDVDEEKSGD